MSSAGEGLSRPLPEQVRLHVVEVAAQVLGSMPAAAVPPPLRNIAKFDPRKRARLGSAPIAASWRTTRSSASGWPRRWRPPGPSWWRAWPQGTVPPAAEPVLVAAAAYLTRPPGWPDLIEQARADLEHAAAAGTQREQAETRLREQLAAQRASAKEEIDRVREQLKAARAENSDLRRKLHDARERVRAAEARAAELEAETAEARSKAASANGAAETELRRLRERLADAERQLEASRRAAREGRSIEDARGAGAAGRAPGRRRRPAQGARPAHDDQQAGRLRERGAAGRGGRDGRARAGAGQRRPPASSTSSWPSLICI
ncbi:hypothetical protein [Microbispora sp. GKU 823]|uniref:hypothetical protein n=1 Tax=Microbispora sp. GKU 823 TaxID=1652100 RepID=UPI0021197FF6|nr:hypothetical protein [Microbispora sp. GKU 823]